MGIQTPYSQVRLVVHLGLVQRRPDQVNFGRLLILLKTPQKKTWTELVQEERMMLRLLRSAILGA